MVSEIKFGQRLKATASVLKLNQGSFARAIGVSQMAVSKWMRGQAHPALPKLAAIARFLNVSIDFLVMDDGVVDSASIKAARPKRHSR